MENWVIFILGLILGVPLSIFANVATPWVKSYFEKSSLSLRERRIYLIVSRYHFIKNMRENPIRMGIHLFRLLAYGLVALIFVVFGVGVLIVAFSIPLIPLYADKIREFGSFRIFYGAPFILVIFTTFSGLYIFRIIQNMTEDVLYFTLFKEKMINKLTKLGGNPEDLDKEKEEQ